MSWYKQITIVEAAVIPSNSLQQGFYQRKKIIILKYAVPIKLFLQICGANEKGKA